MAGKYFIARNDVISKNVFGRKLPKSRKKLEGEAVHYAQRSGCSLMKFPFRRLVGPNLPRKFRSPPTSTRWFRTSFTVGRRRWCGERCAKHCELPAID